METVFSLTPTSTVLTVFHILFYYFPFRPLGLVRKEDPSSTRTPSPTTASRPYKEEGGNPPVTYLST